MLPLKRIPSDFIGKFYLVKAEAVGYFIAKTA